MTRNCRARRSAISLPAGGNTEANGAGELLSKLLHFNSIRRRRTPILRVVEPAPNETCPTPTVQTPSTLIICAVEFLRTFCIQPWEARSMHTRGVAQGSESAGWPLTTAYCIEKNTTCRAHGQSAATHVEFKAFLQGDKQVKLRRSTNSNARRIRTPCMGETAKCGDAQHTARLVTHVELGRLIVISVVTQYCLQGPESDVSAKGAFQRQRWPSNLIGGLPT